MKIPAGVDTGDRIRLAGEGEAGRNGGPPGDLYVEVHVREHPIFERDGEHLSCEVPISFATAALGGSVEVPTLDGDVTLKIPAETQSGRVFRLRDKGVKPVRGNSRGDLFCRVVVETPVHLSAGAAGAGAQARGIAAAGPAPARAAREGIPGGREALLLGRLSVMRSTDPRRALSSSERAGAWAGRCVRVAGELPGMRITGAVASCGQRQPRARRRRAGGRGAASALPVTSDLPRRSPTADVAIDFSQPHATRAEHRRLPCRAQAAAHRAPPASRPS